MQCGESWAGSPSRLHPEGPRVACGPAAVASPGACHKGSPSDPHPPTPLNQSLHFTKSPGDVCALGTKTAAMWGTDMIPSIHVTGRLCGRQGGLTSALLLALESAGNQCSEPGHSPTICSSPTHVPSMEAQRGKRVVSQIMILGFEELCLKDLAQTRSDRNI